MNPTITFYFKEVSFPLRNRKQLKATIINVFKRNNIKVRSVFFIFCTDKFLLKVNQDYLSHDYYTDIITFDLSNDNEVEGEIYISVERVKENANSHNVPFILEIYRVVFHGILHLCGMKDKTSKAKEQMRVEEDKLIELFLKKCST